LKGQPGTKSTVKPTWSVKVTVLSTFMDSLLNFLSNDKKEIYRFNGTTLSIKLNTHFVSNVHYDHIRMSTL